MKVTIQIARKMAAGEGALDGFNFLSGGRAEPGRGLGRQGAVERGRRGGGREIDTVAADADPAPRGEGGREEA